MAQTPKDEEREKLENDLLDIVANLQFPRGKTIAPFMYPELVDFILADRAAQKEALLAELEAEANCIRIINHAACSIDGKTHGEECTLQSKLNAKWRTLIQQKKGKL